MSYYKENQKIIEHNERVLKDIINFAEYINGDLALKYSIEECQLLQPLVMLLCRYIMYSGLYNDVVFHLETASDIREVVKNARAYFIETSFFILHSEEPISRRMEEDLINFVFFSIESAGLEHAEKRAEQPEQEPDFEEQEREVFELIKDLDDDQLKDFESEEIKEEPKEEPKEERQPTFMEFMKDEGYDEDTLIDDITLQMMQTVYRLKYLYNLSDDELPPKTVTPCFKSFEEYNAEKQKHKQLEQAYESEQITQQIIKEIEVGIDTCDTLNDV